MIENNVNWRLKIFNFLSLHFSFPRVVITFSRDWFPGNSSSLFFFSFRDFSGVAHVRTRRKRGEASQAREKKIKITKIFSNFLRSARSRKKESEKSLECEKMWRKFSIQWTLLSKTVLHNFSKLCTLNTNVKNKNDESVYKSQHDDDADYFPTL